MSVVTELNLNKDKDTCVIYGCGYSLKNLDLTDWRELSKYDAIGFNWFIFQNWVKPQYMIVGDVRPDKNVVKMGGTISEVYQKYGEYVQDHKDRYEDTIFVLRQDQLDLMPSSFRDMNYHIVDKTGDWEISEKDKIYHANSALFASLNIAAKIGYTKFIFAGVDLYDYRFFFLDQEQLRVVGTPDDKPRWADRKLAKKHPIHRKIVPWFENNKKALDRDGISELYSFNLDSLLLWSPMIKEWENGSRGNK